MTDSPTSKTESLADRFNAKFSQAHSQSRPMIISWELAVEIRDALSGDSAAPDTGLAGQIEAARARIAEWPADVRAAMGLPVETSPQPARDAEHCDFPDCEQHNALVVEQLRDFLRLWTYEGRLQSFEDRERFRKDAAKLITPEEPPDERGCKLEDGACDCTAAEVAKCLASENGEQAHE